MSPAIGSTPTWLFSMSPSRICQSGFSLLGDHPECFDRLDDRQPSHAPAPPQPAQDGSAVCKVEAFVEKPDAATAARYVADARRGDAARTVAP
jgi:hypothetical protein